MWQVIDDNKLLLKAKYDEAKALGEAVNASKARINEAKGQIELWRAQRAAACECAQLGGRGLAVFSNPGCCDEPVRQASSNSTHVCWSTSSCVCCCLHACAPQVCLRGGTLLLSWRKRTLGSSRPSTR
jgi:hypothetical protein